MRKDEDKKMANLKRWMHAAAFSTGLCLFAISVCPASGAQDVPVYRVDPSWPKTLPNNWVLGMVRGLAVDKDDHIWVMHGPGSIDKDQLGAGETPPRAECCIPAPPVLEFDAEGNLLKYWGPALETLPNPYIKDLPQSNLLKYWRTTPDTSKQYEWFAKEHSIFPDRAGNLWLSGNDAPIDTNGDGKLDRQVLKFTTDGKFVLQIGHYAAPKDDHSLDTTLVGGPAGFAIDEKAHELFMADGYYNRRVAVFDSDTGKFKRMWGAYGNVPDDKDLGAYKPGDPPAQQFRPPVHCIAISDDGLVYVCDRGNDRIQVFTKEGKFVKEFLLDSGAACKTCGHPPSTINFSHDAGQNYLLVSDGQNNVIWILRRSDGVVAGKIGRGGQNPGEFHRVHSLGSDSHGNLYTGELNPGERVQKFVLVSPKADQVSQAK